MAGAGRGAMRWRSAALVALALAVGCSLWREEPPDPSVLPPARLSPDAVVLDIFTLDAPRELTPLCEDIWRQLDEQHIPAEVRVRLSANGVRCGRCGLQLPPAVFGLLEKAMETPHATSPLPDMAPGVLVRRRLQSRAGRRGRIVMNGPHNELTVLWRQEDEERAETFNQATCVIAVRTFPLGDGRARVELTPEIEHGQPKMRLTDGDGALRWEPNQDRRVYDDLSFETILAPGQTLLLSATPAIAGLGRTFFARESADGPTPLFLVIRLAQTQHDDRFAPEKVAAPLVTPVE